MPQPKENPQRSRRAMPILGTASLSFSLASGAFAAMDGLGAHLLTPASQQITLHEEEISDVSLATFRVVDKENVGTHRPRLRVAFGCAGCGCAGCGGCGCACGIGLYRHYTPPVVGGPVYPSTPPARPARPPRKHR
jgi:hypothetical protein